MQITTVLFSLLVLLSVFGYVNSDPNRHTISLDREKYYPYIEQKGKDIMVKFTDNTCTHCPNLNEWFNEIKKDSDLNRLDLATVECGYEKDWCYMLGITGPFPVVRYVHDGLVFHYSGDYSLHSARKFVNGYFTSFGYGFEDVHENYYRDEL